MWRLPLALGLAFLALLSGAIAALSTDFAAQNLCGYAQSELTRLTAQDVRVGSCRVDPRALGVTLSKVRIGPKGAPPMVEVERLSAVVHVKAFPARLALVSLEIDRPRVRFAVPESTETPKPPNDRCLPDLSRFELGDVVVRRAEVSVTMPGGLAFKARRLSFKAHGSGPLIEARARLRGGWFQLDDETNGTEVVHVQADALETAATLDLSTGELSAKELVAAFPEGTVTGALQIQNVCKPVVTATLHADVSYFETMRHFAPEQKGARGTASADVRVRVAPEAKDVVVVDGEVRGRGLGLLGLDFGDVRTHANLTPSRLRFDKLDAAVGAGRLTGSGEITFEPIAMKLDARLAEVTFSEVMRRVGVAPIPFGFTGTGRILVSGPLVPDVRLTVQPDLEATDVAATSGPYDSPKRRFVTLKRVRLTGTGDVTSERTILHGMSLAIGSETLAIVDGPVDYRGKATLALKLRLPRFNAADVGSIAGLPWSGRGSYVGTVVGLAADPDVQLDAALQDFSFINVPLGQVASHLTYKALKFGLRGLRATMGRTTYDADADVDLSGAETGITSHVEIEDGRVIDLIQMAAGFKPKSKKAEGWIDARIKATADVDGTLDQLHATMKGTLREVNLAGQRFDWGDLDFELLPGNISVLKSLDLHRAHARVVMAGEYHAEDEVIAAHVRVKEMNLDQLDAPRNAGAQLAGSLQMELTAAGTLDAPVVRAHAALANVAGRGVPLGSGAFDASIDGNAAKLWGSLGAQNLEATYDLGTAGWTALLGLNVDDFTAFLPPGVDLGNVGGGLAGEVALSGGKAAGSLRGKMRLRSLRVTNGSIEAHNDGPVLIELAGDRLLMKQVKLAAPYTTASATGWVDFGGHVDLGLRANLDLGILLDTAKDLEHAAGEVELTTQVTGTAQKPNILGTANVKDGELRLHNFPVAVREIDGALSFSQDDLVVEHLTAKLNSGGARLSGEVHLNDFSPTYVRLGAHFAEVPIRAAEQVSLYAGGDLNLAGDPREPVLLTGDVEISRLHYTEEIDLERMLLDMFKSSPPQILEKAGERVKLDVGVHLGKDVRVDNNVARAGLVGDLRVTGTNRRIGLVGGVQVEKGGVTYFRGNEFAITDAHLDFTERQRIAMAFDINAQAKVHDYKVTMRAFGKPSDPRVIFTSEPPLPEGDILTLITLGITSRELARISGDAASSAGVGIGIAAAELANASGLNEQVRRFLPKNGILRDPTVTFTSEFSEASGKIEPMAEFQATLLTEAAHLRLLYAPLTMRGRGLIEYKRNEHLSTLLRWDNEHEDASSIGDWGLDLRYRWESE